MKNDEVKFLKEAMNNTQKELNSLKKSLQAAGKSDDG